MRKFKTLLLACSILGLNSCNLLSSNTLGFVNTAKNTIFIQEIDYNKKSSEPEKNINFLLSHIDKDSNDTYLILITVAQPQEETIENNENGNIVKNTSIN